MSSTDPTRPAWITRSLCAALGAALLLHAGGFAAADEPVAPPAGETKRPAPAAQPALTLVYRGVFGTRAIIEDLDANQQASLSLGEEIRGYKVTEIQPKYVVLVKGTERLRLTFGMPDAEIEEARDGVPHYPYALPKWVAPLRKKLTTTRMDLDVADVSLAEAIAQLRARVGVSVLFDPAAAPFADRRITAHAKAITLGEAFKAILGPFGLTPVFENGLVVVTTLPAARENAVEQVESVLRDLDVARGKAAAGASPEDRAVREALASLRVTLKCEAMPFPEAVGLLQRQTAIPILLDAQAFDPRADTYAVTCDLADVPLGQALAGLLPPLGLAHAVRQGALVLSTTEALAEPVAPEAGTDESLKKPVAARFEGVPLYRAATDVAREVGLEVVLEPELWALTPKVTWQAKEKEGTLQAFLEAVEKGMGVRHGFYQGRLFLFK